MADTWEQQGDPATDPQPQEQAPQEDIDAAVPTATVEKAEDDDEEDAVELKEGERFVPLRVVKALREQNKALKPKAERADALEQELSSVKPYAEFLKNNPQLMQRPEPAPAPRPDPATVNAEAEGFAKELDLYTPDGKPDVARATRIIERNRQEAQAAASAAIQPMQRQSQAQQAQANLVKLQNFRDANGQPIEQQYIDQTVAAIAGQMSPEQALATLANPQVADLLAMTALGLQNKLRKGAPAVAQAAPLGVESPQGGGRFVLPESSKRLAAATGIPEKRFVEAGKVFKNNDYNDLE